jgi:hypothetical protein
LLGDLVDHHEPDIMSVMFVFFARIAEAHQNPHGTLVWLRLCLKERKEAGKHKGYSPASSK